MKETPLIKINLDHVVPDELHLFLRIMDVLIENVINHAITKDVTETRCKHALDGATLKMLQHYIRQSGISFNIWKTDSEKLNWTSLGGGEKRKVLTALPQYFQDLVPSCCSKLIKLWKDFEHLYSLIGCWTPDPNDISIKAKEWIETFLSLSSVADGYQKENVTPYMHVLAIHVPGMIAKHRNMKQFSCQSKFCV